MFNAVLCGFKATLPGEKKTYQLLPIQYCFIGLCIHPSMHPSRVCDGIMWIHTAMKHHSMGGADMPYLLGVVALKSS